MFSTNVETRIEYAPGDPILIKNIVSQLKSQGVFDQFRKECISDVDTKPAYQNLCHRVDGRVESYLADTKWGPDLNKNQLRENIRKYVNECTFVDSGISRIVDQLVNPRINTVLVPKVEDIVYSYLGIERPQDDKYQVNGAVLEKTNVFIKDRENDEKVSTPSAEDKVTSSQRLQPPSNKDFVSDFKNGIKQEPLATDLTHPNSIDVCSDIESDEDDISPPFEPHEKSDTDMSAESDYSMDVPDFKCDLKSEPNTNVEKSDVNCDKIFRNLERICGEESRDSATSSCTEKVSSRKPSLSLDLPNTPSINYETSDESQDDHSKRSTLTDVRRESTQNKTCPADTNSMDSYVEKTSEDDKECSNNVTESNCSALKIVSVEEKGQESTNSNQQKRRESQSGDSKDSKRDDKYSDHKKEKSRSDKHGSSRSDKDRKSTKDKDRSNSESKSRSTKDKHSHDRKEHGKESEKSKEHKESEKSKEHGKEHSKESEKSKNHEKSSKDRDSKHRESSKSSSSTDKSRSSTSRTKSGDPKDDRKKKSSSSKHDDVKDREKSKHRKEDSSDAKKSKTQCNTDNKKSRTDRRSSDRDSSGPSSSSHNSSHRSSSKTDKEKHRHSSSSSSSSQKSKKNVETKDSSRSEDTLFNTMMSVTGSALASLESSPTAKVSNIENTSSLLDILNDNGESKSSHVSHNRKISSLTDSKEVRKKEDDSAKRRSEKKTDESKRSKSSNECTSVSKNSSVSKEVSKVNISDVETKKPKIARNAADILRIMELRKQYREKMKTDQLLLQQGKENTNLEMKKEVSINEIDQKSILSERSVDNCVIKKIDKSEKISDEMMSDSFGDCKLKIKRIDSHYRLVNGSCNVDPLPMEQSIVNNNDINMSDNNTGDKIENSIDAKRSKQDIQSQSKDIRINGNLRDGQQLTTAVPSLENVINNENFNCDRRPIVKKPCFTEDIGDVLYFESAEINVDFKNFVAKRIRESEEIYLENFSIHLKCPERYDYIFRNQLRAQVTRKGSKSEASSPFKYNSEIIDNRIGNEKGIMMRIKKTLSENEAFTAPFEMSRVDSAQRETPGQIYHLTSSDPPSKSVKGVSGKRKTLGMKRSLSTLPKSVNDHPTKMVKLNHDHDTNGIHSSENSCLLMPDSKTVGDERIIDGSCRSLVSNQVLCNSTLDNQRSTETNNSMVPSSVPSTPRIHKPMSQEQKRKQFYYDANDLYKPRHSLASSRRSRGLNVDKT